MPAGGLQNSPEVLEFLKSLGTKDRGDKNLKLNNTAKALVRLGQTIIETATENLRRGKNIATGDIAASMKIKGLKTQATSAEMNIVIDSRFKFLNYGVNGVGKGGKGRYNFRYLGVSKKMHTAILTWLNKRGAGGRLKYAPISGNERKNKDIRAITSAAKSKEQLAYAVAMSIKKRGIKPTYFFSNAIRTAQAKARREMGAAFKLDIIESIRGLNDE